MCRGVAGSASCVGNFDRLLFLGGPGGVGDAGSTATPQFYCDDCGNITINDTFMSRRSFLFRADPAGSKVYFHGQTYIQGSIIPVVSSYFTGGGVRQTFLMDVMEMDTTAQPLYANFAQNPGTSFTVNATNGPSLDNGVVPPLVSGFGTSVVGSTVGPGYTATISGSNFTNNSVKVTVWAIWVLNYSRHSHQPRQ